MTEQTPEAHARLWIDAADAAGIRPTVFFQPDGHRRIYVQIPEAAADMPLLNLADTTRKHVADELVRMGRVERAPAS